MQEAKDAQKKPLKGWAKNKQPQESKLVTKQRAGLEVEQAKCTK